MAFAVDEWNACSGIRFRVSPSTRCHVRCGEPAGALLVNLKRRRGYLSSDAPKPRAIRASFASRTSGGDHVAAAEDSETRNVMPEHAFQSSTANATNHTRSQESNGNDCRRAGREVSTLDCDPSPRCTTWCTYSAVWPEYRFLQFRLS